MRKAVVIFLAFLIGISVFGTVGYSQYSQVQVTLNEIVISDIEFKPQWQTVFYVVTQNYIQAIFSLIHAIELDLSLTLTNPGVFPLPVPRFDHMLYGNNIQLGAGQSLRSVTLSPQQSEKLHLKQTLTIAEIQQLVPSIVAQNGLLYLNLDGILHLDPLPINLPLEYTMSIDLFQTLIDAIKDFFQDVWNHINTWIEGSDDTTAKTSTILTLNTISEGVVENSIITFSGRLVEAGTETPISGVTVDIFDSDIEVDDLIISGVTDGDGKFAIPWTAKAMDPFDNTVEIYAKFDGTSEWESSRTPQSNVNTITVAPFEKISTTLSLTSITSIVTEYTIITFTGTLTETASGLPVSNARIQIIDSDVEVDDVMVSGVTDAAGRYSIDWTAKPNDPFDRTVEIHAKFDGTTEFSSAQTSYQQVLVEPFESIDTILILDVIPSSITSGSTLIFNGTLKEADTDIPVSGVTVTIYDSDIEFDDVMASGITDSEGRFQIYWTAKTMDWWDNSAEIYAKFESSTFYNESRSPETHYALTIS